MRRPLTLAIEVVGLDEVGHDPLRRALGDPDALGDVAHADVGIAGDADDDVRVVGQEGPLRHAFSLDG
ncbi:MAG: hypothetical protein PGN13_15355 [Patulibacter minatonensis]